MPSGFVRVSLVLPTSAFTPIFSTFSPYIFFVSCPNLPACLNVTSSYLPACLNLSSFLLPSCYLLPTFFLPSSYLLATFLLPSSYLLPTFLLPSYYLLSTHHFVFTKRIFSTQFITNSEFRKFYLLIVNCQL